MTLKESKSIGGRQLLKAATFVFVLYEIGLLYTQTRGDFANGILFFFDIQMNVYFLMFIILYFLSMFLSGQLAGYNILIKKRNHFIIALFCAFLTTLLTIIFFASAVFLITYKDPDTLGEYEFTKTLFRGFFVVLVPMTLAWIWATNRIKIKVVKM